MNRSAMFREALLCTLTLLIFDRPAFAHHSVTATYDTSKVVTLTGEVLSFEIGSPHSRLIIAVPDAHDHVTVWHAELPSTVFLQRAGWTETSLRAGERVKLTGSPGRHNHTELYVRSVTLKNGSELRLVPAFATAPLG